MQINDLHILFSSHAEDRLLDRGVSKDQLAYLLHDKYKNIKLMRFAVGDGKKELCYKSGVGNIIFSMKNKTINVITILEEGMKVKNALVI
jgi:hypothetical protein